jgi:hypothetical protein
MLSVAIGIVLLAGTAGMLHLFRVARRDGRRGWSSTEAAEALLAVTLTGGTVAGLAFLVQGIIG